MVYFVGAGPGAADLITVRGMRLLEKGRCGNLCGFACESGTFILLQKRV
mgnify:FL=1